MHTLAHKDRIQKGLESIARDRRSGASELALRALRLLGQARPVRDAPVRSYRRDVCALARSIGRVRPSMVPVGAVADKFLRMFAGTAAASAGDSRAAYRIVRLAVDGLERALTGSTREVAKRFAARFARIRRPLVISYSSQVIAAVTALPHRSQRIVVCESRPALEGRRTAQLLAARAKSVTVITEAQVGAVVEGCDCALLGSDAIYADGSVTNKSGSYLVALACRHRSRPVIVVGDRFKMSETRGVVGETHDPGEVWKNPPRGIRVTNEYFERVPRDLINHIVLEDGVYRPADLRNVWRKERKTRA